MASGGSHRCRRMGGPFTQGSGSLKWAAISTPTKRLSETGGALADVVRGTPETHHSKRDNMVIPGTSRQSEERQCPACPPLADAAARRRIGVLVEGSTRLFGAGALSGRERWCTAKFTISPPLWDSSTVTGGRQSSRPGNRLEEQQKADDPRPREGRLERAHNRLSPIHGEGVRPNSV